MIPRITVADPDDVHVIALALAAYGHSLITRLDAKAKRLHAVGKYDEESATLTELIESSERITTLVDAMRAEYVRIWTDQTATEKEISNGAQA